MEVTQEAQNRFRDFCKLELQDTAWTSGCQSWYHKDGEVRNRSKIDTINSRFRISLCGQRIQFNFGGKLERQTRKISIFTPFQVSCSSRFIVVNVLDVVRKFEVTDLN